MKHSDLEISDVGAVLRVRTGQEVEIAVRESPVLRAAELSMSSSSADWDHLFHMQVFFFLFFFFITKRRAVNVRPYRGDQDQRGTERHGADHVN